MWLTTSPDINHTVDLNTTSSYIEKKQDWWSDLNNTIDKFNSKLALNNLKIELPKTKEQQEKDVYNNIYKYDESFLGAVKDGRFKQWITVKYITKDIFSVYSNKTKDISFFSNKEWQTILMAKYRSQNFAVENKFLDTALNTFEKTWYFMNAEKWDNNIYKIIWKDEKWEFILSNEPLDKKSVNYFNALKTMVNHYDSTFILIKLKYKLKFLRWHIDNYINSWVINLKLLQLIKNKNLFETSDIFEYAIKNMNLTIQDIVTAKNDWDITEQEWREIYNILQK